MSGAEFTTNAVFHRISIHPNFTLEKILRIKHTMKKLNTLIAIALLNLAAHAQPDLKTTVFDLEGANLNLGYKVVDAGTNNGKIFVTYGKPACEMTRESSVTQTTYKYYGVSWELKKLFFDNNLQYLSAEEKSFENTRSAFSYAPVLGKEFDLVPSELNIGKSLVKGTGGLLGMRLTPEYIGTKVVAADVAITGFKIATSEITTKIQTYTTKIGNKPANYCSELPAYTLISSDPAKEVKGQKWVPQFSNPIPNGGHILFATLGVYDEPGKGHYVFRQYDGEATVTKELVFTLDYYGALTVNKLNLPNGGFDYVIISRTVDYKDKQNLKSNDPLFTEYIRIDGEKFEIKERFSFNVVNTSWLINKAMEVDGAVYLAGPASDGQKKSGWILANSESELPNYQIAKIANGKVEYISAITPDEMEAKTQMVPGVKGKVSSSSIVGSAFNKGFHVVNDRLFIQGQQLENDKLGVLQSYGNMVVWAFNARGALDAVYFKPESATSDADLLFSKDGSKMYWAMYDNDVWNKVDMNMVTPKQYGILAPQLQIATINNATNKIEGFKVYGEDDFAVAINNALLFNSETHVGFTGRSLTKKFKDSDLVLITFEK